MTNKTSKKINLNIRIDREEVEEFHEVCKSKGTDVSKAIRKFIKEQIKDAYI